MNEGLAKKGKLTWLQVTISLRPLVPIFKRRHLSSGAPPTPCAAPYKPHEYGLVILPMTVIKRFHDCLTPTHDAVLAAAEKYKAFSVKRRLSARGLRLSLLQHLEIYLRDAQSRPENIEDNFKDYINGFSDNVQDILARMKFADQIERLSDPDAPLLYQIICDFCKPQADMSPDKIRAVDMGYIFENLIQRFSESYDEDAGAHFTESRYRISHDRPAHPGGFARLRRRPHHQDRL